MSSPLCHKRTILNRSNQFLSQSKIQSGLHKWERKSIVCTTPVYKCLTPEICNIMDADLRTSWHSLLYDLAMIYRRLVTQIQQYRLQSLFWHNGLSQYFDDGGLFCNRVGFVVGTCIEKHEFKKQIIKFVKIRAER